MGGQLSKTEMEKLDPEILADAKRRSDKVREQLAPPGALGLPEQLDARRLEYGIIDGYFAQAAVFEKVFIFPIEEDGGEFYGGGLIARTDQERDRDKQEAPRGIIVSAGLKARDALHSNGIELGDIVTFTRGAVTRIRAGWLNGKQQWLTVLYADDISGSLDQPARVRSGALRVKLGAMGQHYFEGLGAPELPTFTGNM